MAPRTTRPSLFPARLSDDKTPRRFPVWAVIGIFLILGFQFIAEARAFLMPATLAMLLFFVFVPFRRLMARVGVGATGSAAIVTLGLVLSTIVLAYALSGPVTALMENSDRIGARLEDRLQTIRQSFKGLEKAAEKIDEIAQGAPDDTAAPTPAAPGDAVVATQTDGSTRTTATREPPQPRPDGSISPGSDITVAVDTSQGPNVMQQVLLLGPAVMGQVVFTLVLLFFLLASGDLMYLKIVQSFDTMKDKRHAYMALREIEDSLGTYLGSITMINLGLGVAIGAAMWAWGMPSPVMWAVAGFLLNYIPYIGAITGMAAGAIVALLVFDDLWHPLMVALTFLALTSLEGQLVTPQFVSRRLQLNEVVVFLTVALWAWLWSVLGMVVAVPVLVVVRVLSEHVPWMQKFGNFLAGEDPPQLEDDDEEDARDLVELGDEQAEVADAAQATAEVVAADQATARS